MKSKYIKDIHVSDISYAHNWNCTKKIEVVAGKHSHIYIDQHYIGVREKVIFDT